MVRAIRESFDHCVFLLQEVPSWVDADVKEHSILSEMGKDCAIGVPTKFRRSIEEIKHGDYFSANSEPTDIFGRPNSHFGHFMFGSFLLDFLLQVLQALSSTCFLSDLIRSRFLETRQMDIQMIVCSPGLDSPRRASTCLPFSSRLAVRLANS